MPRKKTTTKPEQKRRELPESQIIRNITFFGDSAIPEDGEFYRTVWETANILGLNGYAVVDGGGPGVMKAATDGAAAAGSKTIAIYWEPKMASIFEGKNISNVTDESEAYANYMLRTLGLIESGHVFVVCQGGTGTISELGMVWALAKLYFGKHKPVILFGDFWPDMIRGINRHMLLDEKELGVLHYAETKEEVLSLVEEFEREAQMRTKRFYEGDESAFLLSTGVQATRLTYEFEGKSYFEGHRGPLVAQKQLDEFVELVSPPAQVLDLGCGPGFDMQFLSQKFAVTGIEVAGEMAELARINNPNSEVRQEDIISADLPDSTFKGIWARDVLHHVGGNDLDYVFKKLYKTMVPGGVFSVIVREGEGEMIEDESKPGGYILKRFYHFFSEQELKDRADRAGFELIRLDHTQRSHKWLAGLFRKPEESPLQKERVTRPRKPKSAVRTRTARPRIAGKSDQ